MTALSDALIKAIQQLDAIRSDLQVLLTLIDTGGIARAEMDAADPRRRPAGITEREHQLLVLLGRGLSNKEMGTRIGINEQSVKNALRAVYRKLHVEDRLQAAVLAHNLGLVQDINRAATEVFVTRRHRVAGDRYRLGPNSRLGVNPNMPRTHAQLAADQAASIESLNERRSLS